MILVKVTKDQHEWISEITISGHSDFAKSGSDIVCAAVSGQVVMLELGVLAHKKDLVTIEKQNGFFHICNKAKQSEIQVLLRSFSLAVFAVEREYPKYINIMINS